MTALQVKQNLRVPQYVHTRLWRDIFALRLVYICENNNNNNYVSRSIDDVWRLHIFLKYCTWSQAISTHVDRVANNKQYAPRQPLGGKGARVEDPH